MTIFGYPTLDLSLLWCRGLDCFPLEQSFRCDWTQTRPFDWPLRRRSFDDLLWAVAYPLRSDHQVCVVVNVIVVSYTHLTIRSIQPMPRRFAQRQHRCHEKHDGRNHRLDEQGPGLCDDTLHLQYGKHYRVPLSHVRVFGWCLKHTPTVHSSVDSLLDPGIVSQDTFQVCSGRRIHTSCHVPHRRRSLLRAFL